MTSATTAGTSSIRPTCRTRVRESTGRHPSSARPTHLFLDLPAFADRLREWISAQTHWRPNVRNFSLALVERPQGAPDHARPRLGRADPGRGLRGVDEQADLRLVRRGDRLSLGRRRVGAQPGPARCVARVVAEPRVAALLLPGEGQHRLPHRDLAEHPARLRRGRRARRRARPAPAARTTSSRASSSRWRAGSSPPAAASASSCGTSSSVTSRTPCATT